MKKAIFLLSLSFNLFSTPFTACEESGMAGEYACQNIDLMSQLTVAEMGGLENFSGNDIWGWTDPETNKEYALMGLSLAFSGDTIVVVIYFYDANGQPRWVLGQTSGFKVSEEINIDLQQFQGYGRNDDAQALGSELAGTISLNLHSATFDLSQDGTMSIDIKYQGVEGNNWQRNNVSITNFSQPH